MNGAVATRRILKDAPNIAVLISACTPTELRAQCLERRTRISAQNALDLELVDAVRKVARTQVLDPRLGVLPGKNAAACGVDHQGTGSSATDRSRKSNREIAACWG